MTLQDQAAHKMRMAEEASAAGNRWIVVLRIAWAVVYALQDIAAAIRETDRTVSRVPPPIDYAEKS